MKKSVSIMSVLALAVLSLAVWPQHATAQLS